MTLIRRMHSLGCGEGRMGWLSNGKYMHWLQDELGLGSRWEWKLCPWAAPLSETGQGRVWEGGEVPLKLSLRDHVSVFAICSMGGLLPEKRKKKWRDRDNRKRERNYHHHHQHGWQGISRNVMQSTLHDILRNPSLGESQGRNSFLHPDFFSTFWHLLQDARPVGMRAWKGRSNFPEDLQVPMVGWVPCLRLGPCSLEPSQWRAQVSGQMPAAHTWLRSQCRWGEASTK